MRLAVVIPVYNHARYVAQAIESCLGQGRKPDRIICIDDGSKDDSLAVCQQYQNRGVEVHSQENQGAHNTINRAVQMAATDCEVISILNSDDYYTPERFARMLPALTQPPARSVVVSGLRLIDSHGAPVSADHRRQHWLKAVWSPLQDPEHDMAEWMGLANFPLSSSNIIARREFLLAHPFKPYRYNHDYYFLTQAAIRNELRVVPDVMLAYRIHETNTIATQNPAPLMRELLLQNLELAKDMADELSTNHVLRSRYYRYMRAAWDNASSFHAGVLQVLMAALIENESPDLFRQIVDTLDENSWPELSVYPNRQLINTWDGTTPLTEGRALAQLNDGLRADRDTARQSAAIHRQLAKARQRLTASRWAGLGRVLGAGRKWAADEGKTPEEKLAHLSSAIEDSLWLRMGGVTPGSIIDPEAKA